MNMRLLFALAVGIAAIMVGPAAHAAPCTVPNMLTNGQVSDASQVMANFNSVSACASAAVTPTGSPTAGSITKFSGSSTVTNGDLSGDCTTSGTLAVTCANFVTLNTTQTISASKRGTVQALTLSGSTATPNFDTGNNFTLTLTGADTMANPSTTPVAGQSGVMELIQDATGSRTLTWGSLYITSRGTSAISLSTAPNARDYVSYYVADSTHIVISMGVPNAVH